MKWKLIGVDQSADLTAEQTAAALGLASSTLAQIRHRGEGPTATLLMTWAM